MAAEALAAESGGAFSAESGVIEAALRARHPEQPPKLPDAFASWLEKLLWDERRDGVHAPFAFWGHMNVVIAAEYFDRALLPDLSQHGIELVIADGGSYWAEEGPQTLLRPIFGADDLVFLKWKRAFGHGLGQVVSTFSSLFVKAFFQTLFLKTYFLL